MTDTLELTAKRIADRGRDALLARLRPAFADAARAHAEILQLDDQQLERMIQRAADRADGLQWRRALATVATQELGIGLGEALGHPAVERAQAIVGAPSYEDSLAALEARPDAPVPGDLRRRATPPEPRATQPEPRATQPEPTVTRPAPEATRHADNPTQPSPEAATRVEPARPEPTLRRIKREPTQPEPTDRRIERKPPQPQPAAMQAEAKPSQPKPEAPQTERQPAQPQAAGPTPAQPAPDTDKPDAAKPEQETAAARPAPLSAAARPAPPASRPAPQPPQAPRAPQIPGTAQSPQAPQTPQDPARPAPRRVPPASRPTEPEGMRVAAIHLGGVTNLRPGESDIELRLSEHGLDIARHSGEIIGRLGWDEIQGLEVPPPRGLLWRRRAPRSHLVVRAGNGDASFEIPSVYPDELTEHLEPVLARYGRRLAMR